MAKFLLINRSVNMQILFDRKLPGRRHCSLLAGFFALALALLLALAHGDTWAGPVEGSPRRGGTLILGMAADPSTLNCGIESSQIVAMVTSNIYNGLLH